MAEPGPARVDDLADACSRAPKFGLNAKALILQAALAQDDEPAAQRADPAVEAAAATARRGGEYLAAVDVKQRPLVAYLARSKIPRINRQTVLNKLAGEHLALAAAAACTPPLEPAAAAADLTLRKAAFDAALAQELELFRRCGSAQVYQNLAARTSATQWPQPGGIDVQQAQQQEQQAQQQAQQVQAAGQQAGAQPPAAGPQSEQLAQDGTGGAQQHAPPAKRVRSSSGAAGKPAANTASRQARLLECDLDWEAAPTADEEVNDAVARAAAGAAGQAAAAALGAPSGQTALGSLELQRLAQLPAVEELGGAVGAAPSDTTAGSAGAPGSAAAAAAPAPAAAAAAAGAPSGSAKALPAAGAEAPNASPAAAAAVRQQVELFVRAELHPLLKRQQISLALHDAVCERCTAKVMACHAGAASADFLVPEAGSIRALVKRYLEHMRRQA